MLPSLWENLTPNGKWAVRGVAVTTGAAILGLLGGGLFGLLCGAVFGAWRGDAVVILAATLYCGRAGLLAGIIVGAFGTLFEGAPLVHDPPRVAARQQQEPSPVDEPWLPFPSAGVVRPPRTYARENGYLTKTASCGRSETEEDNGLTRH